MRVLLLIILGILIAGITIGLVILQVILSKNDNKALGIILPAVSFFLAIILVVSQFIGGFLCKMFPVDAFLLSTGMIFLLLVIFMSSSFLYIIIYAVIRLIKAGSK